MEGKENFNDEQQKNEIIDLSQSEYDTLFDLENEKLITKLISEKGIPLEIGKETVVNVNGKKITIVWEGTSFVRKMDENDPIIPSGY